MVRNSSPFCKLLSNQKLEPGKALERGYACKNKNRKIDVLVGVGALPLDTTISDFASKKLDKAHDSQLVQNPGCSATCPKLRNV